jgi:hypothetical protein
MRRAFETRGPGVLFWFAACLNENGVPVPLLPRALHVFVTRLNENDVPVPLAPHAHLICLTGERLRRRLERR